MRLSFSQENSDIGKSTCSNNCIEYFNQFNEAIYKIIYKVKMKSVHLCLRSKDKQQWFLEIKVVGLITIKLV